MRPRGPFRSKHERTTASAIVTFWCIETDPGGAPTIRPIWSPTVSGSSHQPSSHARTPRVFQARAYSSSRSSAAAGMAPSEWLIRYVVSARIGNRSRYAVRSTDRAYRPRGGRRIVPRADERVPGRDLPSSDARKRWGRWRNEMNVKVGDPVPEVRLDAYVRGESGPVPVSLSDYRSRWVVLFFYPRDFTFVCPTELAAFHELHEDFEEADTVVVAASTDSYWSHRAWLGSSDLLSEIA